MFSGSEDKVNLSSRGSGRENSYILAGKKDIAPNSRIAILTFIDRECASQSDNEIEFA